MSDVSGEAREQSSSSKSRGLYTFLMRTNDLNTLILCMVSFRQPDNAEVTFVGMRGTQACARMDK